MKVFLPTLAYCLLIQVLGLYVASFLLIAGFMWWVGRIAAWKALVIRCPALVGSVTR